MHLLKIDNLQSNIYNENTNCTLNKNQRNMFKRKINYKKLKVTSIALAFRHVTIRSHMRHKCVLTCIIILSQVMCLVRGFQHITSTQHIYETSDYQTTLTRHAHLLCGLHTFALMVLRVH